MDWYTFVLIDLYARTSTKPLRQALWKDMEANEQFFFGVKGRIPEPFLEKIVEENNVFIATKEVLK